MLAIRFIHYLGFAMWIGGGITVTLVAVTVSGESPQIRAAFYRRLTSLYSWVIGIGALLTVGSGILWSMSLVQASGAQNDTTTLAFWVMVLTGFAGGALVLFVAMPTAVRLGRVAVIGEDNELLPVCERYRSRLSIVSSLANALAVVSLFASVVAT